MCAGWALAVGVVGAMRVRERVGRRWSPSPSLAVDLVVPGEQVVGVMVEGRRVPMVSPVWVYVATVAAVESATDDVVARLIGAGGTISLHWGLCRDLIPVLRSAVSNATVLLPVREWQQGAAQDAVQVLRSLSNAAYATPEGRFNVRSAARQLLPLAG